VKLLFDTNVLVAAPSRGTCNDLLEHCVRQHVVISSPPLLNELREVLDRKFRQRAVDVRSALRLFAETFTLVTPDALDPPPVATATTMRCWRQLLSASAWRLSPAIRIC